jgi:hypothetical protein
VDGTLGERFAIPRLGLVRLSEIVGEVAADQLAAGQTSRAGSSFVNVGDAAVGTDRDQRIEARLHQASGVARGGAQFGFGTVALGDVVADRRDADNLAAVIVDRRHGQPHVDAPARFGNAHGFVGRYLLPVQILPISARISPCRSGGARMPIGRPRGRPPPVTTSRP